MRAALGGVLFSTPDLLILDEPTNYLDLEGAAWLEAHLRRYPNTVLVVSHDRSLLNQAVTHILALDQKKLSVHAGGYDLYQARRAEQIAGRTAQAKKQDEARARIQSFVDRFRAKASKARQAQSRIKALERMQTIEIPLEERTIPFRFEDPPEAAAPLLELDECDLGYVRDKPILRNVSLRIDPDDRVAIVGANGQGKSTLVKTIAARLSLMKGERRAAKGLVIGYFSQDQLDELRPDATPLEHVRDAAPANASQAAIRSIAAQIGFGAEKVQTPASSLSGGEKVRLLLGLIALKKPHLLILDEPTSHLDIDSREALIHALNDYNGAVLLITHDVFLAEAAAERIWLVNGGQAAPYQGDLAEYRALVLSSERATAKAEKATPSRPKPVQSAPSSSTLKRRIEAVERALADAHAEVRKLELILAAPGAFEDGGKGADAAARRATAEAQVSALEEEWLELSSTLEATKR
jgi:ATP-binding cassette subfamily F protein 3